MFIVFLVLTLNHDAKKKAFFNFKKKVIQSGILIRQLGQIRHFSNCRIKSSNHRLKIPKRIKSSQNGIKTN